MALDLTYDNRSYRFFLDLDGSMTVRSNPFYLTIDCTCKALGPVALGGLTGLTLKMFTESKKSLKSIDGFLDYYPGLLKIEIKKGVVYLQDRSLDSLMNQRFYLHD